MSRSTSIAIIGAGPAGLLAATALHRHGIHCDIYETRPARFESRAAHAALSLQPNGLRVLEAVGILPRLRSRGHSIEKITIKDLASGGVTTEGAGIEEAYGHKRLRIYRAALIEELQAAVDEAELHVQYGCRFSHIVRESEDSVTFAFADGSEKTADLLIGADGINSRVRAYVAPSAKPVFSGLAGLGAQVPASALRYSAELGFDDLPATIKNGKTVVNLTPQDCDGSQIFVGRGKIMQDRSSDEWKALESDREGMRQLFNEGLEDWPDVVRSAVERVNIDEAYLWPVYTMPRLDSWISQDKRVAILGDAAHAVSPITGQGVNQAFEDAYMLASVLAKSPGNISIGDAMTFWQSRRMARVHEMVDRLVGGQAAQKRPVFETKSRVASSKDGEDGRSDAWLYGLDIDSVVDAWANNAQ